MPLTKSLILILRLLSKACLFGVFISVIIYNFFVQFKGLHQPPCSLGQAELLFRSTVFCASKQDVYFWNLNESGGKALIVGLGCLVILGTVFRRRLQGD